MPKTISERVAALRERAAAQGLKRLEIYAHPEDWAAIKTLAEKLQKRREKAAKVAANDQASGARSVPLDAPVGRKEKS
jgi:hypothetical protein